MKNTFVRSVRVSLAFLLALAFVGGAVVQGFAQSDTIQTTVPQLKNVFAKDFRIGCLLSYRNIGFPTDPPVPGQSAVATPNGGYLIKFHMNNMSPGNNMKPMYTVNITSSAAAYAAATTQPAKDSINIHPIVAFNGDMIAQLNWAARQGFTFRGHTLVWHNQTPAAFFLTGYSASGGRVSKDTMILRMDNYMHEVFRLIHEGWPGLLVAMDVVNEAIDDNTGMVRRSGNDWYTTFGDTTYVMKAFEIARKYTLQYGENQIKLYYNDYNTDTPKKADGIVRLCTPIFQAGLLDGIGMQEHNSLSYPTAQAFIATYNKFAPICSEMSVTELDVATGVANPSSAVLARQANQYGMLFKCFVERSALSGRGKIISVSKDGLNDAYTFVANQATSLWDAQNKCKPAFFAVVDVGMHYNTLDSLITFADTLKQSDYTTDSWSHFATMLTASTAARDSAYSVSVSADTALGKAVDSLQAAINGLTKTVNGIPGAGDDAPLTFVLDQNYPNPFNPTTVIRYTVPAMSLRATGARSVRLVVYDVLGREVATLVNETQAAGTYQIRFDGTRLASGIYVYQLTSGGIAATRSMILMK